MNKPSNSFFKYDKKRALSEGRESETSFDDLTETSFDDLTDNVPVDILLKLPV